jgi:uncharacterized membrane protein YbhN (UPF0104 family)
MKWQRVLLYTLSAVLIVGGLIWFLKSRGIHFEEVSSAIGRFHLSNVVATVVFIFLIQLPMQSTRLWALIPAPRQANWWTALRAFMFGQAINCFAPARAGDAVKVVVLNRESQKRISIPMATGVLLSDKLIDIISFTLLCLAGSHAWAGKVKELPFPALRGAGLGILAVLAILAGVYFALPRLRDRLRVWYQSLSLGLAQGLAPLKSPRQGGLALAVSILGWIGELLAIQALCSGQGYSLTWEQVLWVMVVLNVGVAIPVAVANIGAFEASMTFGLGQVGVPAVEGLAVATVHHAFQILGVYFWAGGLAAAKGLIGTRASTQAGTSVQ